MAKKVREVMTTEIHTIGPDDTTKRAAQVMREQALRRLPVVDGSNLTGMVSIGDLALTEDPKSPLADISAAPPTS